MTDERKSNQVRAAERVEEVARELAASTRDIPKPSDSTALLESLKRSQETLDQVYRQLAEWHGAALEGVHHGGEKKEGADPLNRAWIRAELALQEAAQYGTDAAEALARARGANTVAQWFDEVITDER
jgi:hypothetical protein